ncbi:MAG: ABC transporter substrate-binding protein [Anaerolineae bacterium]|jgi:multiple sugar transport system substrate-binding protein|nr:ABC transporter substrate-binding protein [Anaerolineae bacterium]
MRNNRLSLILALVLLALPLFGSVVAQEATPEPDERANRPITLTLAGWSSSQQEDAALSAQLDAFMDANADIYVQFVPSTDHPVTMQTAFASGTYPEVFYVDSSRLPDWATAGVVAIGDDLIDDPEGFYPSLLDIFTFEGDLYCAPKDFSTMALQYNKDLFDAAGLEYPTADWTWEDLRAAAEALTDTEAGVIGLVTPPNLERWLPFLYQNGGTIFDEEGNLALDSEEAREALDFYMSFARDGIGGTPSTVDAGWGGEAFGTGRAAMAMEGNWVINFLLTTYPELNWGVAELPAGEMGKATMAFTVCYGVAANIEGEKEEAAWRLVNFLTNAEGSAALAEVSFGPMPPRPDAMEAYLNNWMTRTEGANVNPEDFNAFITGADYAYPWVLPVGFQPFIDEFNAGLQQGFEGQATADDIILNAVSVAEEILAESE